MKSSHLLKSSGTLWVGTTQRYTASDINDNKLQVSQVLSWKLRMPLSGRGTDKPKVDYGGVALYSDVVWGMALYSFIHR